MILEPVHETGETVGGVPAGAVGDPAAAARAEVAARIAREVRGEPGGAKLAKVSSLVHAFRVPESPTRFHDVRVALAAAGVGLDAEPAAIRRTSVVTLVADPAGGSAHQDPVHASLWRPGAGARDCAVPLTEEVGESDVVWFDVEPVRREGSAPEPLVELVERRAAELIDQLSPWCPGLELDMVRDLLREDPQPKVDTYGSEHGAVRSVSVVAAIAREVPEPGAADRVVEQVVFQLVEIVVGEGWVLTCWHPSRTYGGGVEEEAVIPVLKVPFLSHVNHRWLAEAPDEHAVGSKTSGDLGVYLVRALIDTYDATHRMMERWMAGWEVEFYTTLKDTERAAALRRAGRELSDFLYMAAEIRRRLTAFQHARWSTADRTWFPRVSGHEPGGVRSATAPAQIQALVEELASAKENFDRLSSDIRADMDVLMLQNTAVQQENAERVQGYLGRVTALVLVPTLIAGIFGANTRLPGGGAWSGFEVMVVLMVISGVGVFYAIRRLSRHG